MYGRVGPHFLSPRVDDALQPPQISGPDGRATGLLLPRPGMDSLGAGMEILRHAPPGAVAGQWFGLSLAWAELSLRSCSEIFVRERRCVVRGNAQVRSFQPACASHVLLFYRGQARDVYALYVRTMRCGGFMFLRVAGS